MATTKTKLTIAAFVLVLIYGLWLAFHVEPNLPPCAGARALICIQR